MSVYDPYMDGTVEAPRLTIFKILSRHARLQRFLRLAAEGRAPALLIERERELLDAAIEELTEVNRQQEWFDLNARVEESDA